MKLDYFDKISRRTFLTSVPAAASVPRWQETVCGAGPAPGSVTNAGLALNGGTPVRSTILTTSCPGSQFYDHHQQELTEEAISTHGLFGIFQLHKMITAAEVDPC
jgi:hypothetical protein